MGVREQLVGVSSLPPPVEFQGATSEFRLSGLAASPFPLWASLLAPLSVLSFVYLNRCGQSISWTHGHRFSFVFDGAGDEPRALDMLGRCCILKPYSQPWPCSCWLSTYLLLILFIGLLFCANYCQSSNLVFLFLVFLSVPSLFVHETVENCPNSLQLQILRSIWWGALILLRSLYCKNV